MLSVEFKKGEKAEWHKNLSNYLKNQYSVTALDEHRDALNYFQKLRDDVAISADKNEATKELYLNYLAALTSVELRFPISENNIRVSFNWTDAFKGKKVSSYSVLFEKAAVLYNLGALYSAIGCLQNRTNAEGVKAACNNFQNAAAAFNFLKEEIVDKHLDIFRQNNIVDMSPDTLNVLIQFMLAQAQECYYEKSVKDNLKSAIVAKLAAHVYEYYDIATNMTTANNTLQSVLPKQWIPTFQLKSAMYKAVTQYRAAIGHGEASEYGLQVARLLFANKLLEEAKKKYGKSISTEVSQVFTYVQSTVQSALQKAEKENDTIYHDAVPNESRLAAIEKKSLAKIPNFSEIAQLSSHRDPFAKLVPFAVTQKLSIYQEKKDSLLRNELKILDDQNQMAIASLASMHLPGSIEAMETPADQLPTALIEKMKQVQADGGAKQILEYIDAIAKLAEEDKRIMEESLQKLDDEESADNELRNKFSSRWHRSPSHSLTSQLRQEAAKFAATLTHAKKSDAIVLKKFQDNHQYLVQLSGSVESVKAALPASSSAIIKNTKIVQDLKGSLSILDKMIADRNNMRNELSRMVQQDDITNSLLSNLNNAQSDDDLFGQELAKYNAVQMAIQDSVKAQGDVLATIQRQNTEFEQAKGSNNANALREQHLQNLNTAHKMFNELKNNLREGIQFYTNFQDILKQFKGKCEDFVFARETEKQDLLQEIQRQPGQPSEAPVSAGYPQYNTPSYPTTTQSKPQAPQQAPNPAPQTYQQPSYNTPAYQPTYQQPPPQQFHQPPPSNYGAPYGYQPNFPPQPYPGQPGYNPYQQPQQPYGYPPQQPFPGQPYNPYQGNPPPGLPPKKR